MAGVAPIHSHRHDRHFLTKSTLNVRCTTAPCQEETQAVEEANLVDKESKEVEKKAEDLKKEASDLKEQAIEAEAAQKQTVAATIKVDAAQEEVKEKEDSIKKEEDEVKVAQKKVVEEANEEAAIPADDTSGAKEAAAVEQEAAAEEAKEEAIEVKKSKLEDSEAKVELATSSMEKAIDKAKESAKEADVINEEKVVEKTEELAGSDAISKVVTDAGKISPKIVDLPPETQAEETKAVEEIKANVEEAKESNEEAKATVKEAEDKIKDLGLKDKDPKELESEIQGDVAVIKALEPAVKPCPTDCSAAVPPGTPAAAAVPAVPAAPVGPVLHHVTDCNQCGRKWCDAAMWSFNQPDVESFGTVGNKLGEWGCDKVSAATPSWRNSGNGAIYAIEGWNGYVLHHVSKCDQCGFPHGVGGWCDGKKWRFNEANVASKGTVGSSLDQWGCDKVNANTQIWRDDSNGKIYAVGAA